MKLFRKSDSFPIPFHDRDLLLMNVASGPYNSNHSSKKTDNVVGGLSAFVICALFIIALIDGGSKVNVWGYALVIPLIALSGGGSLWMLWKASR